MRSVQYVKLADWLKRNRRSQDEFVRDVTAKADTVAMKLACLVAASKEMSIDMGSVLDMERMVMSAYPQIEPLVKPAPVGAKQRRVKLRSQSPSAHQAPPVISSTDERPES